MAKQRSNTVTYGTRACVVPSNDNPYLAPAARKANSFSSPLGRAYGVGWLLLRWQDVEDLKDDQPHNLVFASQVSAGVGGNTSVESVTLQEIYMKRCERLTPGVQESKNAVYLVEVVDKRYLAHKMSDTNQITYDVYGRGLGDDDGDLPSSFDFIDDNYANNKNYQDGGGNPVSKTSLLAEAWGPLEAILGTMPSVGQISTGIGINSDLYAQSQSAWDLFNTILEATYFACCYDPIANTFALLRQSIAQTIDTDGFDLITEKDFFEFDQIRFPETYRVYFSKTSLQYGQERDTERDDNWINKPLSTSDVLTASLGGGGAEVKTVAGTIQGLYSPSPSVLDYHNGSEDQAALDLYAKFLSQDHFSALQLSARSRKIYTGFRDVACGSEVKVVVWRNYGTDFGGSATEIINHEGIPISLGDEPGKVDYGATYTKPPLIDLRGLPNYPRVANYVKLYDEADVEALDPDAWSGSSVGEQYAQGIGTPVYHGRVVRWVNRKVNGATVIDIQSLDKCWIMFIGLNVPGAAQMHSVWYGRLSGQLVSGDYEESRPVYLVEQGGGRVYTGVVAATGGVDLDLFADPATGDKLNVPGGSGKPAGTAVTMMAFNGTWHAI